MSVTTKTPTLRQIRRALHGDARTAMGLKRLPNGHGRALDSILNEHLYVATRAALQDYLMRSWPIR